MDEESSFRVNGQGEDEKPHLKQRGENGSKNKQGHIMKSRRGSECARQDPWSRGESDGNAGGDLDDDECCRDVIRKRGKRSNSNSLKMGGELDGSEYEES